MRNAALRQKNPAFGGIKPAIGDVPARGPDALHRAAHRACPNGRFDAMKWVPITARWYYLKTFYRDWMKPPLPGDRDAAAET